MIHREHRRRSSYLGRAAGFLAALGVAGCGGPTNAPKPPPFDLVGSKAMQDVAAKQDAEYQAFRAKIVNKGAAVPAPPSEVDPVTGEPTAK
ncbi:MAG: hypothetical protein ACRC1K_17795 [Planctomycetia bacterium]